jgi:hypothetical protein
MTLAVRDDGLVRGLLEARPERFARVLERPEALRVQILLSLPDAGGGTISTHGWRVDAEYVYPASTIKTIAAVAAMNRLRAMAEDRRGVEPDLDTPLLVRPLRGRPGTDRLTSVRELVRRIALVSDNPAHNHLYELLGHRGIHEAAWGDGGGGGGGGMGLSSVRHHHRLGDARTREEHLITAGVDLLTRRGVVSVPEGVSDLVVEPNTQPGVLVGERHVVDGRTVDGPMDFAFKNRVSMVDLHRLMLALVLPEHPAHGVRLGLHEHDRGVLLEAMAQLPRDSTDPVLAVDQFPDHFAKPMLPGVRRVWPAGAGVGERDRGLVINKVGQAYGFSLDNAVIVDRVTGKWAAVTAAIYANSSGTVGADTYDYASVALPFFVHLGETVAALIHARA